MQSSAASPDIHATNFNATDTRIAVPGGGMLPSYEAAVGALDNTKLPSYRRTFSARFHPYKRPTLKNIDELDRLFNTVFDEEYIPLNVPTASRGGPPVPLHMIDDAEATQRLRSDIETAIQFELRVQRLDSTIVDLVESVSRAHIPQ